MLHSKNKYKLIGIYIVAIQWTDQEHDELHVLVDSTMLLRIAGATKEALISSEGQPTNSLHNKITVARYCLT
jgi:hypothetical protein